MINSVPSFWDYNKDMETLYSFFQRSEEMLSKYTVDTYHVKMHNTLTLCEEALLIYNQLDRLKIIDEYYSKYMGKSIAAHCSYGIDGVPYVYWFENHGFNDYRIIIREVDYR